MKQTIIASIVVLIIAAVPAYLIERYKYHDCKNVGHTTMYCIFNMIG
jgi:hypothetical protein